MAGAFAAGFKLGGDMFSQAERVRLAEEQLKLQKARDARDEEEFGWRRDEAARARAQQAQVDSLTRQLTNPNYENTSLTTGAPMSPGLRTRTEPALPENVDRLDAPMLGAGAAGPGLRMRPAAAATVEQAPVVPPGLRATLDTSRAPTFNAAPTGADAEEILGRIALVKGDTAGFRTARDAARNFREDDLFKSRIKEYTGSAEQIGSFVGFVNNNSKSVTLGQPDKRGFADMSIVTPSGEAVFAKLSKADQAKLYAAVGLMEMNPTKALEMISGVNKELAAAVAADNNLTLNVGGKQNEVAGKRAAAIAGEKTADAAVTNARSAAGLRKIQGDAITKAQANRDEAAALVSEYEALTPEEQAGPKGIGLIRRFNMLNVKAGGQVSLGGAGKSAADSKPVKVPEEGEKVTINGRLMYTDGLGGYIPADRSGKPAGVMPSVRDKALLAAGLPENALAQLPWNADGTAVGYRGKAYRADNPADMRQLAEDYKTYTRNDLAVEEYSRQPHSVVLNGGRAPSGFGPRITYTPDPRAPSIYAGPEAWAEYRRQQREGFPEDQQQAFLRRLREQGFALDAPR